jgi:hypothetical protein
MQWYVPLVSQIRISAADPSNDDARTAEPRASVTRVLDRARRRSISRLVAPHRELGVSNTLIGF